MKYYDVSQRNLFQHTYTLAQTCAHTDKYARTHKHTRVRAHTHTRARARMCSVGV